MTDLFPCVWGKLFVHKGAVYMLATSTEYGDLLISRFFSHETRNLLSLMRSKDCEHWNLACDWIDCRDEDPKKTGFQYVDFDGEYLIFLSRTTMNHPRNYHAANYSTFHRVLHLGAFNQGGS